MKAFKLAAAFSGALLFAAPLTASAETSSQTRGARMVERMCGAPVKARNPGRYAERLSERLTLTDAQKALLKDWQDAVQKAREDTRAALCNPKPDFGTFAGRMAYREKRLETQLSTFRATRPKLEAFYAALDDKQKAAWDDMRDRRYRRGRFDRDDR